MAIDEQSLKSVINQFLAGVASLPRSKVGYQGDATPLRMGVYAEFQTPHGVLVADPAFIAQGQLALREWITVRAGKAGGREHVKPGGGFNLNLGGLGIGSLLKMITGLGAVPNLQISGTQMGGGYPVSQDQIAHLLMQYFGKKNGLYLPLAEDDSKK